MFYIGNGCAGMALFWMLMAAVMGVMLWFFSGSMHATTDTLFRWQMPVLLAISFLLGRLGVLFLSRFNPPEQRGRGAGCQLAAVVLMLLSMSGSLAARQQGVPAWLLLTTLTPFGMLLLGMLAGYVAVARPSSAPPSQEF